MTNKSRITFARVLVGPMLTIAYCSSQTVCQSGNRCNQCFQINQSIDNHHHNSQQSFIGDFDLEAITISSSHYWSFDWSLFQLLNPVLVVVLLRHQLQIVLVQNSHHPSKISAILPANIPAFNPSGWNRQQESSWQGYVEYGISYFVCQVKSLKW